MITLVWEVSQHIGSDVVLRYWDAEHPELVYKTQPAKVNPTAKEDVIRTQLDLLVRTDYQKHWLTGLKGEITLGNRSDVQSN